MQMVSEWSNNHECGFCGLEENVKDLKGEIVVSWVPYEIGDEREWIASSIKIEFYNGTLLGRIGLIMIEGNSKKILTSTSEVDVSKWNRVHHHLAMN